MLKSYRHLVSKKHQGSIEWTITSSQTCGYNHIIGGEKMRKILGLLLLLISAFVLVACGDKTLDPTINAPTNVQLSDEGVLSWNAVSGADYYIVYIDQRPVEVKTGTSLDLTQENILVGDRIITVVTVKGDGQSLPSTAVTYTVLPLSDPAVITEGVITILDPTYTSATMTRNDFDFDWQYEEYQSQLKMAQAYAEATSSINMTEANALGFFTALYHMMSEESPDNLSDLMSEMEMFDTYGVNPYAAANILYHLQLVSMEMQYDREVEYEYGNPEETLAMLEALEANSIITIQSLEIIIDFLMTFKDSLSNNVIGLLDNAMEGDMLTTAEMIIIKNEVVNILKTNLPTVTDFAFLYSTLMYIGGAMSGEDVSGYIVHADFMGELTHLEITIALEFIGSIAQTNVDYIQNKILEIASSMTPNLTGGIDLALYVLTFIDEFKTEHASLFTAYDELMEDEALEALFILGIDQVIFQIENDSYMSVSAEMIIEMLEAYKAEYDTIRAAMEVIQTMGENVIQEFLTSEAQFFYVIAEAMATGFDTPEEGMEFIVTDLLPLFVDYNTAIFAELDQESILAILEFLKFPITLAVFNTMFVYSGMSSMSVMEVTIPNFDAILPHVAQVLANVFTIERAIVNAAAGMDIDNILENDDLDSNLKAAAAVIRALDLALTPANVTLINDTIGIVFDDILKNPEILPLLGVSSADIDEMKTMVLGEVASFIEEIQDIADFNYAALTYDDETRIEEMAMMIGSFIESIFGGQDHIDMPYVQIELYDEFEGVIYVSDGSAWIRFIPDYSGYYMIYSTFESSGEDYDTYISLYIYDDYLIEINNDDDNGDYANFQLIDFFDEGEIYYFEISFYYNREGYIPFVLELLPTN